MQRGGQCGGQDVSILLWFAVSLMTSASIFTTLLGCARCSANRCNAAEEDARDHDEWSCRLCNQRARFAPAQQLRALLRTVCSIYGVHDEAKDKAFELELSWICEESGREHKRVSTFYRFLCFVISWLSVP